MLGIRAAFREDRDFPLLRPFLAHISSYQTSSSTTLSFLKDLQTTMAGRSPPPTRQNSAPAPASLPEELLLARFILVRRDTAQLSPDPIYNGPYCSGAVNPFLSSADKRENRQGLNTLPQAGQDTS
jgi:hypothetical protein